MIVKSTEVQNNFGRFLEMASQEEIIITKNGTAIARLIGFKMQGQSLTRQLRGIIPADADEDSAKYERMIRHEGSSGHEHNCG